MGDQGSNRRETLFGRFQRSQRDAGLACDDDFLLCPMCWTPQRLGNFTLEHIVPSAVGGRRTTLTCRTCNNQQGRDLDAHLVKHHQVHDALNGFGGIPCRLNVNGKHLTVNFTAATEPIQLSMRVVGKASHPGHVLGLQGDSEAGNVDELQLRMNLGYDQNRMQTALLRIGYLALFHRFGYEYVAGKLAQRVRERIIDPTLATFRLPSFVSAIKDWKFPFDRAYFLMNGSLNDDSFFQVIIRCRIQTTSYHGIALPGLKLDDEAFFSKFEAHTREHRESKLSGFTEADVFD
jgi:hypothetical protein